jgi:hypothetical protein
MSKETMHDFYVATARKRGNGWKATKLDKIYVFLSSKLSPLQDTFGTDQQQEFLFGFDHMRGWIRMKKEDRIEWEKKNGAAPAAFLWNKDE